MPLDGSGWWRRTTGSVRFRITAIAALTVLGVLAAGAISLTIVQHRLLLEGFDDTLSQRADDMSAFVRADRVEDVLAGGSVEELIAQVLGPDGEVLAASPLLAGRPALADPLATGREAIDTIGDIGVEDGRLRVLARGVESPSGPVTVVVADDLEDIDRATVILAWSLAIAVPTLTALFAVLIWWLVGRTLRPVEAIRSRVASVDATDLHQRVPEPPGDDEIAQLARTMNGMLDRIDTATTRQQRFVADASHELRSPLTRMRTELEVDLLRPDAAEWRTTHRSLLEETGKMQHLVDDLLHLARSDAGAAALRDLAVDLDDIVLREAQRLRAETDLAIDTSAISAAQVRGDPDQLARAVRNVADNAARHARSRVSFSVAERDGSAVVAVTDDGEGIASELHDIVFERFARLDEARTSAQGGSGLGLAITRDIVVRHGGTVTIDPTHGPGARFVIALPMPPSGDGQ